MSQYISYIYYGDDPEYDNWLNILNGEDGVEVHNEVYFIGSSSTDGNSIAVDQDGNTYIVGFYDKKITKIDSEGNILVQISYDHPAQIAISPDGSLYLFEYDDDGYYVRKRSLETLQILDEFKVDGYGGDFWGMAFDSNGFLYMMDHSNDRLEKWNVTTKTRVGTCDFSGMPGHFWGFICSIGIVGTKILICSWASAYRFYETDTDLSPVSYYNSDLFPDPYENECLLLTSLDNKYFVVLGSTEEYADRDLYLVNADLSIVWQVVVPKVELSLGAYTYRVGVYDYPLSPIVFPAKVQKSTLKEKCRNFEESMSDVCLVLNHNVRVTRRYLQETYGDTTHPESSNLRFVLPSQQLVKITTEGADYNEIINNFIPNISAMFTLINENNTLIKAWLHDYAPTEIEHEFTDVKMKPVSVGDDLSKAMDDLFDRVIDNVTILNANLEVLIERF